MDIVDHGIHFLSWSERKSFLRFFRFDTRTISSLATFDKPVGQGLAVSLDRKWMLYTHTEQSGELMLVDDFR